jgi:hypothetical protein
MDLTRNVIYRFFRLNDEDIQTNIVQGNGIGGGISGSVMDYADYSDVDIVQFMEKRSQEDGMDAGDVFKGARRIRLAGTLYGTSRAALFDKRADLREALDPVLAQLDEPADRGYQPLYFSEPTLRLAEFPSGYIDKRILALPRAYSDPISRDSQGGNDIDSLALMWQATLIARDPLVYGEEAQEYDITGTGVQTATLVNRGNYYAPLNMLMVVGSAAGSIAVQAGTSVFTITVPSSTGNRTIRVKGADKVLTVEESDTEITRQDLITFAGTNTWAKVPPGTTSASVTYTSVTAQSGSLMWFWESYC